MATLKGSHLRFMRPLQGRAHLGERSGGAALRALPPATVFDAFSVRPAELNNSNRVSLLTAHCSLLTAHCSLLTASSSTCRKLSKIKFVLLADSIVIGKDSADF